MSSKYRSYDCLNMLGTCSRFVEIGVTLLEEVCQCGHALKDTHPSSLEASFLLFALGTRCSILSFSLHHAYLDAAMLPP